MQDLKGKKFKHEGNIYLIQSVFKLKNTCSILCFLTKDGAVLPNSHVKEIKLTEEKLKQLIV